MCLIYCYAYESIIDFKISCDQLLGYAVIIQRNNMYSFIYNYYLIM